MSSDTTRIAIVDADRCKPSKCNQECKRSCPVVKMGKLCIEVTKTSKVAFISETLCNGCNICTKKCPMEAIKIINIPKSLEKETSHRYNSNGFKLHRLPIPRSGQVLGLVGANGTGKTTALKILAGLIKPNLGNFIDPPDWKEIVTTYRGSELQTFLKLIEEKKLSVSFKPQHIDMSKIKGTVEDVFNKIENKDKETILQELELTQLLKNQVSTLSGGEAQRFAIALAVLKDALLYVFDEPSSYLDIRQRITVANVISNLGAKIGKYVIVIEHDLAMIDYLADSICVLYGTPGAYGVVTRPMKTNEGLNIFLDGHLPSENMRFRDFALSFKTSARDDDKTILGECGIVEDGSAIKYPELCYKIESEKSKTSFELKVEAGSISSSQITLFLGQNGTGKTTFVRMLAGFLKPSNEVELPEFKVSYKPQLIKVTYSGTVSQLLYSKIAVAMSHVTFQSEVVKPLGVERLYDQEVGTLSGGELQRVAIVLALGKPANVYLIDEPSAYLDSEQRMIVAKVIRRFILQSQKSAMIVEHDFIMATYMADQIIVFSGQPGKSAVARSPLSPQQGLNLFLKEMNITLRRDATSHRPRINKLNSVMDRYQKSTGIYFDLDNVPADILGKFAKTEKIEEESVAKEDEKEIQEHKHVKVRVREKGAAKNRQEEAKNRQKETKKVDNENL
jgi:ATP-binding cassette subfamily E protein 1